LLTAEAQGTQGEVKKLRALRVSAVKCCSPEPKYHDAIDRLFEMRHNENRHFQGAVERGA
jgi:hypothetical protein